MGEWWGRGLEANGRCTGEAGTEGPRKPGEGSGLCPLSWGTAPNRLTLTTADPCTPCLCFTHGPGVGGRKILFVKQDVASTDVFESHS